LSQIEKYSCPENILRLKPPQRKNPDDSFLWTKDCGRNARDTARFAAVTRQIMSFTWRAIVDAVRGCKSTLIYRGNTLPPY
jgi:hypothetical protein